MNATETTAFDRKQSGIKPELESLRVTPADGAGLPTTPEGHRLFESRVNAAIKASKQRLVERGYTDAQGNVIRPELGDLPEDGVSAQNGRRPA